MNKTRLPRGVTIAIALLLLANPLACQPDTAQPTPEVIIVTPTPVAAAPTSTPETPTQPPEEAPTPPPTSAPAAPSQPLQMVSVIVDNADPDFTIGAGDWGTCENGDCQGTPHGPNFRFADPSCTSCRAQFDFSVASAGEYDVWAWWPWGEDRATDAPFTIMYSGGPFTVNVNLQNGGDSWWWLATLPFEAGETVSVIVEGTNTGYANADAVGLTPAGAGEPGQMVAEAPVSEIETSQVESPEVAPTPAEQPTTTPTEQPATPPPAEPVTVPSGQAIIIDHTCTDLSKIPDHWIEEAKKLTLHYGHTSHGSQIISGIQRLEEVDPKYDVAVRDWDPAGLPDESGALRIYDGNNWDGDNYIMPEMYWADEEGKNRTRSVANTGQFNLSMWSWCGQQSSNSEAEVNQYLETLNQFETEFPHMRFIYMTGHSDGTSGSTLARNNQMVRDHATAHGKVLFDFEDIESHDPAGNYYPNNEEGECTWCNAWCDAHPDDCANLPYDCAHSESTEAQKFNCKLKANAFWWMMARLAGWEGE